MGGNEDDEDGHVDGGYDGHGAPLLRAERGQSVPRVWEAEAPKGSWGSGREGSTHPNPGDRLLALRDDGDPVDDDLHEELDLEDPARQDEEEQRDARMQRALEKEIAENAWEG